MCADRKLCPQFFLGISRYIPPSCPEASITVADTYCFWRLPYSTIWIDTSQCTGCIIAVAGYASPQHLTWAGCCTSTPPLVPTIDIVAGPGPPPSPHQQTSVLGPARTATIHEVADKCQLVENEQYQWWRLWTIVRPTWHTNSTAMKGC